MYYSKSKGVTLIEALIVAGLLVTALAIAMPAYRNYIASAQTVDAINALEAVALEIRAPSAVRNSLVVCDDSLVIASNLESQYLKLGIGSIANDASDPAKGQAAALTVSATIDQQGKAGVNVARSFHQELTNSGSLVRDSIMTDTVVAFSVVVSVPGQPFCAPTGTPVVAPNQTATTTTATVAKVIAPVPSDELPTKIVDPLETPVATLDVDLSIECPKGQTTLSPDDTSTGVSLRSRDNKGKQEFYLTKSDPVSCILCRGPKFICERSHWPKPCTGGTVTNPIVGCINDIENLRDGSRYVTRRCATASDLKKDWVAKSSTVNDCSKYDVMKLRDSHFECALGCMGDDCNLETVPNFFAKADAVQKSIDAKPMQLVSGDYCAE